MNTDELIAGLNCEAIHAGALRIMEEVGLELPNEQTRTEIASVAGIKIKGNRVLISSELAEKVVTDMKAMDLGPDRNQGEWWFGGGGHCHWWHDFDGELKPFTTKNLPKAICFTQGCEDLGVSQACPGFPTDEPGPIQPLIQMRIVAEYTGKIGPSAFDDSRQEVFAREMFNVFDVKFDIGAHTISPLKLEGNEWDMLLAQLELIRNGTIGDTVFIGNMPAVGGTAPCDYNAAWAQSVAEVIGAAAIVKSLGFPKVVAEPCLYPFDLRSGIWVYGSAEHALITLMEKKVRQFYGLPPRCAKSLESGVVEPNVQAASEKTFHTTLAAMAGYRVFTGAGCLGIDDIWSPTQLMVDVDIVNSIKHIISNGCKDMEVDIVEAVKEGVSGSNFFAADLTLSQHRQLYWSPNLFERQTLGQWLAQGKPGILKKAEDNARSRLENLKIEPKLDRDKAAELDRIISRARKVLSG
ncbi:MAG: trimethylamine methyltransferase family protein [Planctomycetota bacterium]